MSIHQKYLQFYANNRQRMELLAYCLWFTRLQFTPMSMCSWTMAMGPHSRKGFCSHFKWASLIVLHPFVTIVTCNGLLFLPFHIHFCTHTVPLTIRQRVHTEFSASENANFFFKRKKKRLAKSSVFQWIFMK